MHLAGVSPLRVEDQALWGNKVSPSTASKLNKRVCAHIEVLRNRPISGDSPTSTPTNFS